MLGFLLWKVSCVIVNGCFVEPHRFRFGDFHRKDCVLAPKARCVESLHSCNSKFITIIWFTRKILNSTSCRLRPPSIYPPTPPGSACRNQALVLFLPMLTYHTIHTIWDYAWTKTTPRIDVTWCTNLHSITSIRGVIFFTPKNNLRIDVIGCKFVRKPPHE